MFALKTLNCLRNSSKIKIRRIPNRHPKWKGSPQREQIIHIKVHNLLETNLFHKLNKLDNNLDLTSTNNGKNKVNNNFNNKSKTILSFIMKMKKKEWTNNNNKWIRKMNLTKKSKSSNSNYNNFNKINKTLWWMISMTYLKPK